MKRYTKQQVLTLLSPAARESFDPVMSLADGIAVYQDIAINSKHCGDYLFLGFGENSSFKYRNADSLPELYPYVSTSRWQYTLQGIYLKNGEKSD